jgi:hypothetical protein
MLGLKVTDHEPPPRFVKDVTRTVWPMLEFVPAPSMLQEVTFPQKKIVPLSVWVPVQPPPLGFGVPLCPVLHSMIFTRFPTPNIGLPVTLLIVAVDVPAVRFDVNFAPMEPPAVLLPRPI